jgi:transcriptional regulator with GAF, ATPase, and Fis domain
MLDPALFDKKVSADKARVRLSTEVSGTYMSESAMRQMERDNLVVVLKLANWRVSGHGGAAELLGIKPTTLESRMQKLSIAKPR